MGPQRTQTTSCPRMFDSLMTQIMGTSWHHALKRSVFLALLLYGSGGLGATTRADSFEASFSSETTTTPQIANNSWFGLAPDNSSELLLKTIESARQSIMINIYTFDNERIAEALLGQIRKGITVQLLIEGEPFRGAPFSEYLILRKIQTAFREIRNPNNRFYMMTNRHNAETKRRFYFNHAKYIIVDGVRVWVASENFSNGGHPVAGQKGNRGWMSVVDDAATADWLSALFRSDADTAHGDVIHIGPRDAIPLRVRPDTNSANIEPPPVEVTSRPGYPIGSGKVESIEFITSPQATAAKLHLIQRTQKSIDLQQASLGRTWRMPGNQIVEHPVITELKRLAKTGIRVRALLNDETVFPSDEPDDEPRVTPNLLTAQYLTRLGQCEGLPIEGRVVDIQALQINYIHNKGYLIDDQWTVVSSINGTRNSFEKNREVAMIMKGRQPNRYYSEVFNQDWKLTPETVIPKDSAILRAESDPCAYQFQTWVDELIRLN